MSSDVTMEEALREAIGKCAGFVSLCWEPRPTGVFDSTSAAGAVDQAVARVLSALTETRATAYREGYNAHARGAALSYEMYGLPKGYAADAADNRP